MGERLDRQQTQLEDDEERISGLEDGTTKVVTRLEKVEARLRTVAIKHEDLEARGGRNNLRIVSIEETTPAEWTFLWRACSQTSNAIKTSTFVVDPHQGQWHNS
ncbi:hypothetical protein NDU88_003322 [Pleurodeles waltl]|uniref:Uncharacterized protein n=1 Tax=Pleurodeles waltl TaxID=8319 RepID=A0AAV7SEX8_PLEWA|nr:hypothetical protein NDU88_003322 [Pleurodeles waltl]